MSHANDFFSIARQGFVRVAAASPRCAVADPAVNLAETLALARDGHEHGAALIVFPELGLSGYAIDDLLLQRALLDEVERSLAELLDASASLDPVLWAAAGFTDTGFRCFDGIGGGSWDEGHSAGSSSSRL